MFIDVRATRLIDLNGIRPIVDMIEDPKKIDNFNSRHVSSVLLDHLYKAIKHFNPQIKNPIVTDYNLGRHRLIGFVAERHASVNGCYRQMYEGNIQLHINKQMATMSITHVRNHHRIGLILPNTQAFNEDYFCSEKLLAFLYANRHDCTQAQALSLLPDVIAAMRLPKNKVQIKDLVLMIKFIRMASYHININRLAPGADLNLPKDYENQLESAGLNVLAPFICKIYYHICKVDGSCSLQNAKLWQYRGY